MRILITTDIEGVASVVHPDQTRPGNPDYERARRLMTQEANAAARGAFEGGAREVLIGDAHGGYRNLLPDELDPRTRYVIGKPRTLGMLGGLETGCDALMLVGFHTRSLATGVLAHTINSSAFARIWLNGQELGEAGLYGALAGERGVPVILASGDDAFAEETRGVLPDCRFVVTKQATGRHSAISLSPHAACAAIQTGAREAMAATGSARPLYLKTPVQTRLQTMTPAHADLFCQWPTLQRLDAVTLEYASDSVEHAVRVLNCLSAMAAMLH